MEDEVRNNEAAHRYELEVDGELAVAEYRVAGERMTFTHTLVPEALEGRGVGSALIKAALEDARRQGLKVVPTCAFVRTYIERHTDQQDLLA